MKIWTKITYIMCIFTEFLIIFILIFYMYFFSFWRLHWLGIIWNNIFSVTSYMKNHTGNSRLLEHRSLKFYTIRSESLDPISPLKLSKFIVDFSKSLIPRSQNVVPIYTMYYISKNNVSHFKFTKYLINNWYFPFLITFLLFLLHVGTW